MKKLENPHQFLNQSIDAKKFIDKGYLIKDVEDLKSLKFFRDIIKNKIKKFYTSKNVKLDTFHKNLKIEELNDERLSIIKEINTYKNKKDDSKLNYFNIGKNIIKEIVGSEIAMQNEISLSIQFPNDSSSLLPVHSDTWSGNSPYEIVMWIPLVDCYATKTMFILENKKMKIFEKIYKENFHKSSDHLYGKLKKHLTFLKINYGQLLIFNQNLPHGNTVNLTKETRWSMNCRFKGLFTPYINKKLGEVFRPISISPASIVGLSYNYPEDE
jgi:sporadic carbohydrate cluster 2OG-Fe(II) oxygenase